MKSSITLPRFIFLACTLFFLALTACHPTTTLSPINEKPSPSPIPTAISTQTIKYLEEEEPGIILDPSNAYVGMIRFEHLSIEEGLSESVVNCMLQDNQGFLWFGTEDGLNRFDGYSFISFKPNADNPNSINDRWITTLQTGADGTIWIGTRQGGLNLYDPRSGKFIHFTHDPGNPDSLANNSVNAILMDSTGAVWVGTDNGLDKLDPISRDFIHYTYAADNPIGPSGNHITALLEDHRGNIWIGTAENGLNRFVPSTGVFFQYRRQFTETNSLTGNEITALQEDTIGFLWVGTRTGLTRFDPENNRFIRYNHIEGIPNSLLNDMINSLRIDSSGDVWIGTMAGLDRYKNFTNKFTHYRHDPGTQDSLSNDIVISIYEDAGRVLWIGTYGGGLNKYNRWKDQFSYYRYDPDNPSSLSNSIIYPILVDTNNTVWIGTYGGGLNQFDRKTRTFIQYANDPENVQSLASNFIYALAQSTDGLLWIGTSAGLDCLNPVTGIFNHYRHSEDDPQTISAGKVNTILLDHYGNLWVGTDSGLDRLNRSTGIFNHFLHESGSPNDNTITYVLEDSNGLLWIGTFNKGLYTYDRSLNQFRNLINDPRSIYSLSNNSISVIVQDHAGTIWVGTAGGGLNKYHPDTGTFSSFQENDGLPNNVVRGILEDSKGNLWVSTNYGLSRFDPTLRKFKNFSASDGLQSNEFSPNSFAENSEGEFYFGGINGLTVFYPDRIRDSSYLPPVVLTSLTQDGNSVNPGIAPDFITDVTLTWPNNSIEFEFASLGYAQAKKNQYAYMLEDFDKTWYMNGTKRDGRYTNLPGGTYTLRLIASNQDGVWNEVGKSINITVVPPFWSTWLFRSVAAVLFLGAVYAGYRIRVRNIQARTVELEKQIHVRTRQIQQRNQEMEAMYKADEKMYRYLNIHQAMQALVDVAVDILKADKSCVFGWEEDKDRWAIKVSRGMRPQTIRTMIFRRTEGVIGLVGTKGKTVVVNHSKNDPNLKNERREIVDAVHQENIRSLALLPIRIGSQIYGIFNLCFTRSNAFNPEMVRLFSALSQRASLSIENALLFEQTKELAILEERTRLAHDLHDSAKQKAFAALAQLGTAGGIIKKNPTAAKEHLEEAENLVSEVIQELTFLIQEMYPMALKEKGLLVALREYIFEWENRNNISVELQTENIKKLPLNFEQTFYRITQEALANIARHSRATQVKINLIYSDRNAQLRIEDNGKGFDPAKHPMGIGLRSMQERSASLEGRMSIDGNPGRGTCLTVLLPLRSED